MTQKFICYTLFDITKTGMINRSKPEENCDTKLWVKKRNTQCNFDTVLQAISLRSQPEMITDPEKMYVDSNRFISFFGFMYQPNEDFIPCWRFTFEVQHASVFGDDTDRLGALYRDVDEIPMIHCGEEIRDLPPFLDSTPELKNIYFERMDHA